ncbi:outer membrane beta-barrel protein [Dysgonomonas termitidis]|uniref:Outer membrane beta-barrel protein n=1 Tax=Dysgonomonas termitidis TaxID=1516126 RepID=A0ABV9KZZ6_9BACT
MKNVKSHKVYKYIILSILNIFIFLISESICAQNQTISGIVKAKSDYKLDYFIVDIFNEKDSTLISGASFYDSDKFELVIKKLEESIIVRISSLGYKNAYKNISLSSLNDNIDIGEIMLDEIVLKEIEIVSKIPTIINKADRMVVNVTGSILSDALNGLEMLQKTPGLIRNRDGISVAGKGTPVYYINGKMTKSLQEIEMINPRDVKSIEVIDNPSSAYDADGHAVVIINTKKRSDLYYYRAGGDLIQARRLSGDIYTEGQISYKKMIVNSYYGYYDNTSRTFEDNYRSAGKNNTISSFAKGFSKSNRHQYRFSTDFNISDRQKIGYQLDGYYRNDSFNKNQFTTNSNQSLNDFITYSVTEGNNRQINNTIYYNVDIDTLGQSLNIITDYTIYSDRSNQVYYNLLDNESPYYNTNFNKGKSTIFSIKADYQKKISKKWLMDTGIKYYVIDSKNTNNQSGSTNIIQAYDSKEKNVAGYINFSADISPKVNMRLGIRGENNYRKGLKGDMLFIDTTHFDFFPSALIRYNYNNDSYIGLAYSNRISRPSLSALDPSLIVDSLMNRIGNPNLKSTKIHSFQFSINPFQSLNIRLGYSYLVNPFYFMAYQDELSPHITNVRFENGKNTHTYTFSVTYNKNVTKWWSFSFFGTGWQDFYKYAANNTSKYNDKISWFINLNNSISLPYDVEMELALDYNGGGSSGTIQNKKNWNLYGSLKKSFLAKTMTVNLSYNDIFRTYISKQRSVLYGNNFNVWDGDYSYIRLGISYQLGKSKYKSVSGNKEEQNRL